MNNYTPQNNQPLPAPEKPKKNIFPYIVIAVLALALLALGAITFLSLNKLADLQDRVADLQETVQEISSTASSMSQKANELENLETQVAREEATVPQAETSEPTQTDAAADQPQEEGTLSPSSGQTFTANTDASMDNLLSQISQLLPTNNGTWSVYVCNLLKNTEGSVNNQPMQAASLIKLFIMGAVYEDYETLSAQYSRETLDSLLESMITISDNDAANTLVTYLGSGNSANGMARVNAFCQDHGYTETSMGRMLLASAENGDNITSVRDCGKFLREVYQLNSGAVTDSTLSHAENMYYLLKRQTRQNKIPAQMPDGVHVANKTGELATVENDAGIVYDTANGIDLVIVFMSQNLTDVGAAQSTIASQSRMIYGYYNE